MLAGKMMASLRSSASRRYRVALALTLCTRIRTRSDVTLSTTAPSRPSETTLLTKMDGSRDMQMANAYNHSADFYEDILWPGKLAAFAVMTLMAAAAAASTPRGQGRASSVRQPNETSQITKASKSTVTDHYELGELLGEGGYASVRMATRKHIDSCRDHASTAAATKLAEAKELRSGGGKVRVNGDRHQEAGGCVAIKTVDKSAMDREEFMHEFAALKSIHAAGGHPNIAGMEDVFEDEVNYYLVLELVSGGELFEHLITKGSYSEKTAAAILRDLADALRFLHKRGIVHADLKPENLMLSSWNDFDAKVKLVDFGCSRGRGLGFPDIMTGNRVNGTPAYWPPEFVKAFDEDTPYSFDEAADMWATGVIMYIMLVGSHPFDPRGDSSDEQILRRAADSKVSINESATAHLSPSAVDLLKRLMEKVSRGRDIDLALFTTSLYDPRKRLTADGMLRHPWTTGEQARGDIMEGVDEKLAAFQQVVKSNLESGLFAILVQRSCESRSEVVPVSSACCPKESGAQTSVEDAVGVIRQAFQSFDRESKGFVNARDILRVLKESGEVDVSDEEALELDRAVAKAHGGRRGVSMESFEQMMSSLENVSFGRGDVVFAEGDDVDASPYMYVLSSGKVDLLKRVRDGEGGPLAKLASLSNGDIFGESDMIDNDGGKRSATVRCATPVQAVRIGKDSLGRMMKSSKSASANLREMSILRDIKRAKSLLRAVGNIRMFTVSSGKAVVKQGDPGDSMYTVAEGTLEVRVKRDGTDGDGNLGDRVATLSIGDVFGEMALMLDQPRSATVVCTSEGAGRGEGLCVLNEIKGGDFMRMLRQSDGFLKSMKVIMRTRLFRQAMLRLAAAGADDLSKEKMRAIFNMVDTDKSQSLDAEELGKALRSLNSKLTAEDVKALMTLADLDRDGSVSFEEFCRILRWEADDGRPTDGGHDPACPDWKRPDL